MAFNIDTFRSELVGDGARPNLFEVTMTIPRIITGSVTATQKLTFMCNTAQLPGSTFGIAQSFYFGREVKLAGNRTYADWSVNVINDEDFRVRNAMEKWHHVLNHPSENRRDRRVPNVDTGYGTDAYVTQFGKAGAVLKRYKFIGLFPVDISAIELNWGSNDQLEEFGVTFAYQYWETLNTAGGSNFSDIALPL